MSILSLYFLASSSPNKGDVFRSEVSVCINPLALRTPPLYFAVQNTEEEYTLYRNLNKNQPFTEKSELCLSTKDSSLKSISTSHH